MGEFVADASRSSVQYSAVSSEGGAVCAVDSPDSPAVLEPQHAPSRTTTTTRTATGAVTIPRFTPRA